MIDILKERITKDMSDEDRSHFTDASVIAQDHSEILAERYSLTERQKEMVARVTSRTERSAFAEEMAQPAAKAEAPAKGDLRGLLDELGVKMTAPAGGAADERVVAPTLTTPPMGTPTLEEVTARDLSGMDPERLAKHSKELDAAIEAKTGVRVAR